jgi:hypothetical protein
VVVVAAGDEVIEVVPQEAREQANLRLPRSIGPRGTRARVRGSVVVVAGRPRVVHPALVVTRRAIALHGSVGRSSARRSVPWRCHVSRVRHRGTPVVVAARDRPDKARASGSSYRLAPPTSASKTSICDPRHPMTRASWTPRSCPTPSRLEHPPRIHACLTSCSSKSVLRHRHLGHRTVHAQGGLARPRLSGGRRHPPLCKARPR